MMFLLQGGCSMQVTARTQEESGGAHFVPGVRLRMRTPGEEAAPPQAPLGQRPATPVAGGRQCCRQLVRCRCSRPHGGRNLERVAWASASAGTQRRSVAPRRKRRLAGGKLRPGRLRQAGMPSPRKWVWSRIPTVRTVPTASEPRSCERNSKHIAVRRRRRRRLPQLKLQWWLQLRLMQQCRSVLLRWTPAYMRLGWAMWCRWSRLRGMGDAVDGRKLLPLHLHQMQPLRAQPLQPQHNRWAASRRRGRS